MLAEGAHSVADLLASSVARFSVSYADKPPDEDHPFGHSKIENLSAAGQGLFLTGVAVFVFYEALRADAQEWPRCS
ncbi:MAG: cation transporter [Chthonomonadaceae bacterium]|nr:cation transporter [Chthonomonadaceae bacterium]